MTQSFVADAPTQAELAALVQQSLETIAAASPDHADACARCSAMVEELLAPLAVGPGRMLRASVSVTSSVDHRQEEKDGPTLCVGTHINLNIGTMSYKAA
jgi:hypothetical protein